MKTRGVLAYLILAFGMVWTTIFVARLLLGLSLENSLVQIPIAFSHLLQSVPLAAFCAWIILSGQLRAERVPDQRSASTNRGSALPNLAQRPASSR